MLARSHLDIHNARASIERIGKLTDEVVRMGPVKIGLEGVLEFIPFVGEAYSVIAGLMLIGEGMRVRAPITALASVATLIAVRTAMGSFDFVPGLNVVGNLAAGAFRGHKWSSDLLVKAIDETLYIEGSRAQVRDHPDYPGLMARVRSGEERRRVVFLG